MLVVQVQVTDASWYASPSLAKITNVNKKLYFFNGNKDVLQSLFCLEVSMTMQGTSLYNVQFQIKNSLYFGLVIILSTVWPGSIVVSFSQGTDNLREDVLDLLPNK